MVATQSRSSQETEDLGRRVGRSLRAGDCLGLAGDLGAGKTRFVKGLVAGLGGAPDGVTSPTFGIVHEYTGGSLRLPVFHFDFYRLDSAEAVEAIGWDDYLSSDGVVVVEWANKFPEILPATIQWWDFVETSADVRCISRRDGAPGR